MTTLDDRFPLGSRVRVLEHKEMEGWPILSYFVGLTGYVLEVDESDQSVLCRFPQSAIDHRGSEWFHESQLERGEYVCGFVPEGDGIRVKAIYVTENELPNVTDAILRVSKPMPHDSMQLLRDKKLIEQIVHMLKDGPWTTMPPA